MSEQDQERFYDNEVAPVLLDLAKKCEERGMPFLAWVGFMAEDEECEGLHPSGGRTTVYQEGSRWGPEPVLIQAAMCARGNLDAMCIGLARHEKKAGLEPRSSVIWRLQRGL